MKHGILLTPSVRDVIENPNNTLENSSLATFGRTVDDIGGGAYHLMYKVGIYAVVLAIMAAGFFMIFSNSQNRGEAKSNMMAKFFGGFLIFAAVSIAVILESTGNGFFTG